MDPVAERYRAVGSGFALDTWSTPLSAYGEFNGLRVPVAGEATWNLTSGEFSCIKLRVTALEYNRPKKF